MASVVVVCAMCTGVALVILKNPSILSSTIFIFMTKIFLITSCDLFALRVVSCNQKAVDSIPSLQAGFLPPTLYHENFKTLRI